MIISGTSFFKCLTSSDFSEGSLLSCITLVDCVNCKKIAWASVAEIGTCVILENVWIS